MSTNKFQPFFNGYLRAVVTSLISLYVLLLISFHFMEWFIFVYFFLAIAVAVLHFLFLIVLYMLVFPIISSLDSKGSQYSFRRLMDRYIPIITIPFAILLGMLWANDCLNIVGFLVMLDMLFTTYIGLYYYLINKLKKYGTAQ